MFQTHDDVRCFGLFKKCMAVAVTEARTMRPTISDQELLSATLLAASRASILRGNNIMSALKNRGIFPPNLQVMNDIMNLKSRALPELNERGVEALAARVDPDQRGSSSLAVALRDQVRERVRLQIEARKDPEPRLAFKRDAERVTQPALNMEQYI